MDMIPYLATVPWRSFFKLSALNPRAYDSKQRFVVMRVHDQLHCAAFHLKEGHMGLPDAVWDVAYYSQFQLDPANWAHSQFQLPANWIDKYVVFLTDCACVHVDNPPLNIENLVPAPISLDTAANPEAFATIELWARLNRVLLEVTTVAGVLQAQAWYHQMRNWQPNEIRFFLGDDGISLFLAIACEQGLLAFHPVAESHQLPGMLTGFLSTLHLDSLNYLYTALLDPDWESCKVAFVGEIVLELLVNDPSRRVKVQFTGTHVADLSPLRSKDINPLLLNNLLAAIPNWPLS